MVKSFFCGDQCHQKNNHFFGVLVDFPSISFLPDLAAAAQQHQQLQNHLDKYRHKRLAADVLVTCTKCLHHNESPSDFPP